MTPAKRRKTSTSSPPAPGNATSDVRPLQPARAQRDHSSPDADLDVEPDVLLCPITRVMFRDPVMVVESGHTYERSAILSHFERNGPKDPLTRLALSSTKVMTNWAVRQMVRDKHPDVTPRPHEAPHGFRHHMDYLAPYSTPLHVASKFGHDTVVKNLIEAGGEIGRHDDAGYTPLDWAAYFGHEGLIPMLLPEPMHLTHLFGYSIMEIASVMGHDIFVKTLFFYVAKSDLKSRKALNIGTRNNGALHLSPRQLKDIPWHGSPLKISMQSANTLASMQSANTLAVEDLHANGARIGK